MTAPAVISLSEVLRATVVARTRRALAVPDPDLIDPALAERLDGAHEQGYAAGYRDGRAEGEQAARAQLDRLTAAAGEALTGARADLAATRAEQAADVVALATDIARVVVAREPSQAGTDALAAVERALADLDDTELTVSVAPGDAELVGAALAGRPGVMVAADARLEPGEARVRGAHAAADLTRAAVWAAVEAALTDDPADPGGAWQPAAREERS